MRKRFRCARVASRSLCTSDACSLPESASIAVCIAVLPSRSAASRAAAMSRIVLISASSSATRSVSAWLG